MIPGFNLIEYTSDELEILLTAIRMRLAWTRDNYPNEAKVLEQFRTKVLEAKIEVMSREKELLN